MRAPSRPVRAARHTIQNAESTTQRRAGAIVGKVRLGSMLPVRQSAARGSALLVVALLCTACTEQAEPVGIPSVETTVRGYSLLTHCGIHEVEIGGRFYRAAPPLDDGAGNPPPGWDNPIQQGTMIVRPDGTATFTDGDLRAEFVLMPNATGWSRLCA
jgi:hypothetical protein